MTAIAPQQATTMVNAVLTKIIPGLCDGLTDWHTEVGSPACSVTVAADSLREAAATLTAELRRAGVIAEGADQ